VCDQFLRVYRERYTVRWQNWRRRDWMTV